MNKKSVITTLRKDFDLVLMNGIGNSNRSTYSQNGNLYFVFPKSKGFNYYITNANADELIRMERVSNKKVIVEAVMKHYQNGIPDSIGISHKTFEFNIGLKRIER